MKKRLVALVLVAVLAIGLCVPAAAAYTQNVAINYRAIKIVLNGKEIVPCDGAGTTVEPFIMSSSGTTYLPLRAIAQALGLNVHWDGVANTVTLKSGGTVKTGAGPAGRSMGQRYVGITYRNIRVFLDGEELNLINRDGNKVEPFILNSNSSVYLPLRIIGEALNINVGWDGVTSTVFLDKPQEEVPEAPVAATGVSLDQGSIGGNPGDTYQLMATVSPENATDKTVSWDSSDTSVAVVSASGLVSLLKPGVAVITATTANGKTDICSVTVHGDYVEPQLSLNADNISLEVGGSYKLEASLVSNGQGDDTVTWTSSDPAVATVDAYGNVKAVGVGTAEIIARAGELSDSCSVVVSQAALNAEQIYAKCASAVFYIEIYDSYGNAVSSGSGVFISEDGKAITNHHVVEDAYSARVMTTDGSVYEVTGYYDAQEAIDMALIQIDGDNFPYLSIGDSTAIAGGQNVFAIGSPLGLDNTISTGIISNPNREVGGLGYIQITVPISHGSSGGALINELGQLIGITSAGFSEGQNLNLAVPIHRYEELSDVEVHSFPLGSGDVEDYSGAYVEFHDTMSIGVGETGTLSVSAHPGNCTENVYINYSFADDYIVSAQWDEWDEWNIDLYLTGLAAGSTTVTIGLYTGSDVLLASKTLAVTVADTNDYYGASLDFADSMSVCLGESLALGITADPGDCEESVYASYEIGNTNIVSAQWDQWNNWDINLFVHGNAVGSTTITISLYSNSDVLLASKTLEVTVYDASGPDVAYSKLKDWIISNSNSDASEDPTYEEVIYDSSTSTQRQYYLSWESDTDYIRITVRELRNGEESSVMLSVDPKYDDTLVAIYYYASDNWSDTSTFEGYANVDVASFGANTQINFYKTSGDVGNAYYYGQTLRRMALDGIHFADTIFESYIPGYSMADIGYANA